MSNDALVLAGGGVAGIAWETGVLFGLQQAMPRLTEAILSHGTTLIGTSAGSTVAAQLAGGAALEDLFALQTGEGGSEILVDLDMEKFAAMMGEALLGDPSPAEFRRRIGRIARNAETPPAAARREVIKARLGVREWPERPLLITAVDTDSGELRVFDDTSGVSLVDAVTASCAVPGVWPTVEIAGHHYMDGGIRTIANADLAAGANRVLILIPSHEVTPLGSALTQAEIDALAGSRLFTVYADSDSLAAFGANPLDPRTRGPAARAGYNLGERLAGDIANFWDQDTL